MTIRYFLPLQIHINQKHIIFQKYVVSTEELDRMTKAHVARILKLRQQEAAMREANDAAMLAAQQLVKDQEVVSKVAPSSSASLPMPP